MCKYSEYFIFRSNASIAHHLILFVLNLFIYFHLFSSPKSAKKQGEAKGESHFDSIQIDDVLNKLHS